MVKQIMSHDFESDVILYDGKVVVDFYADWCGPCKMIGPVLEQLSEEFPEIRFVKINIDENRQTAIDYDIQSIPTLITIDGGEEVARSLGVKTKDMLIEALELQ
ncbi:MAG: thioredoxin [Clostridiales bacterium]|nr:MAG: thioredoxin [Clostridiales bacterium]